MCGSLHFFLVKYWDVIVLACGWLSWDSGDSRRGNMVDGAAPQHIVADGMSPWHSCCALTFLDVVKEGTSGTFDSVG